MCSSFYWLLFLNESKLTSLFLGGSFEVSDSLAIRRVSSAPGLVKHRWRKLSHMDIVSNNSTSL